MLKGLVVPNDPILLKIAEEIPVSEIKSQEVEGYIENMLNIAYGHQEDRTKAILVGLAAPQIIEEEYSGYTARIFQHETDHLFGKEFVDLVKNDSNLHWVEDEDWPAYRNQEAWRNWPQKCPRERWYQIKGIKN